MQRQKYSVETTTNCSILEENKVKEIKLHKRF